jgi:hypothetical protein
MVVTKADPVQEIIGMQHSPQSRLALSQKEKAKPVNMAKKSGRFGHCAFCTDTSRPIPHRPRRCGQLAKPSFFAVSVLA